MSATAGTTGLLLAALASGSVAPSLATEPDVSSATAELPPPPTLVAPRDDAAVAYSRTVTSQFRSFAYVERRQRKVSGALRIGAGSLLVGVGIANAVVKRGTTAQGSGLGIFGAGAVAIAGGAYSLAVPGPAEAFVRTELFDHGAVDGWTKEMLGAVYVQTEAQAKKARRRRRILGTMLVVGGTGAAGTISTLLGLELNQEEPDGALTSSYAQGIATSVGVIVSGITQLVVPTIIEVLARDLRRNR